MKIIASASAIAGGTDMIPIARNTPPDESPRFPLGRVVMTANAACRISWQALMDGLRRHEKGDWGDLCGEDASENELSVKDGFRLLSVYVTGERRFWIITEADRSVTTILMPEDY
jgi:hypothetical protein